MSKFKIRPVGLIFAQLLKSLVVRVIAYVVLAPICLGLIWFVLPRLIGGPDGLFWLVTGVAVIASLFVVYILNKLCYRIDEHFAERNKATKDESIEGRR